MLDNKYRIQPSRKNAYSILKLTFIYTVLLAVPMAILYFSFGAAAFLSYNFPYCTLKKASIFNFPQSIISASESSASKKSSIPPKPQNFAIQKLKEPFGSFLHISDIHYDPHYSEGSPVERTCHKPKHSINNFGYAPENTNASEKALSKTPKGNVYALAFGTPYGRCDSPDKLLKATSTFIAQNLLESLDFVVLTGDNCRHDLDPRYPMNEDQVYQQNSHVFSRMRQTFDNANPFPPASKKRIKLVFSIGNNDVYPHNKLSTKPSNKKSLRLYTHLYSCLSGQDSYTKPMGYAPTPWIDPSQKRIFLRGGYYAVDIEDTPYRIISLNTMYFYTENKKAGGCKSPKSSGLAQLGWLRSELILTESLGKKAILIGHIHPHKDLYRKSCFNEYRRTVSKFSHIIKAQLFGHVNHDAWVFVEPLRHNFNASASSNPLINSDSDSDSDTSTEWEKRVDRGDYWWLYENLVDEDLNTFTDDDSAPKQESTPSKGKQDHTTPSPLTYEPQTKKSHLDNFISDILSSYKQFLNTHTNISKLTVATLSHSIIPRYHSGLKVIKYNKVTQPHKKDGSKAVSQHAPTGIRDFIDSVSSVLKGSPLRNPSVDRDTVGTLMDYEVYWLNLTFAHYDAQKTKHLNVPNTRQGQQFSQDSSAVANSVSSYPPSHAEPAQGGGDNSAKYSPKFQFLYKASTLWGLHNLTVPEYIRWAKKLTKNKNGEAKLFYQVSTFGKEIEDLLKKKD